MKRFIQIALAIAFVNLFSIYESDAQTSTFTYQGRLNDNGSPANGIYDLRFTIYDAVTNGTAVSSVVTKAATVVSNGLFTAQLNFGSAPFNGSARWLEIAARTNGGVAWITLSPLRPLTSTPYAIQSANAAVAATATSVPGSSITGTISDAQLSTNVALLNGGANFSSSVTANNFIGSGSGLSGVWKLGGNAGVDPTNNFLGTTDSDALELKVNNVRALRLETGGLMGYPNIVAGSSANLAQWGVYSATISGGAFNTIQSDSHNATIAGGSDNTIDGAIDSSIGGGEYNHIKPGAQRATIGGGFQNSIESGDGTIGGGYGNAIEAFSPVSTISGGVNNRITATAHRSTISGGIYNMIASASPISTIGGGSGNVISNNAENSTISGGLQNTIGSFSYASTIGGGNFQLIGGGSINATIAGGTGNQIIKDAESTVIGGGNGNTISTNSHYSLIGGGFGNGIDQNSPSSLIAGGFRNRIMALSDGSVISGGATNLINSSSDFAFIGGGAQNTISNGTTACAIVGGSSNRVAAGVLHATVLGGLNCLVSGTQAMAGGRRARATHQGSFVWGDSTDADIASTANNQFTVRAVGGVRFFTNVTPTNNGVQLAANGNAWSSLSDRNAKKNFQAIDSRDVLEKLAAMPVQKWNYKWESDSDVPHIGPMAQDFKAAFYPGRDDKSITTMEFDNVALAAIQGVNQKLEEQNARLKKQNEKLEEKNETLEQRLVALEQLVQKLSEK